MKTLRKVLSFAVSLMMVFSLMTVVSAAENPTVTADGHSYSVYQIFTGDLTEGKVLSNIKWGQNGTGTEGEYVSATITNELAGLTGTDVSKLGTITKYVNLESTPYKTIAANGSVQVEPGYYIFVDTTTTTPDINDAKSLHMVKVIGSTTLKAKKDVPEVDKVVYDEEKGWGEGADYDIGDNVPFKLIATLGDTTNYAKYFVQFDDTLCAGLKYNNNATVKIGENDVTDQFTITYNETTHYLEIKCADVKNLKDKDGKTIAVPEGTTIIVEYTAELTQNAVIGNSGNFNEIALEYSNNPNVDQNGKPSEDHGKTPTDKVVVFTYNVVVNKIDGNGAPLTGAGFTLYKGTVNEQTNEITWTAVKVITGETTFEFKGVDSGIYKLEETTVPEGYNKADDIVFKVKGIYDNEIEEPVLTEITVKDTDGNDLEGWTITLTPGVVTTDIANYTGATLPETGGMGTTVLYVGGSLLMLGAAILLVSKKRMSTVK